MGAPTKTQDPRTNSAIWTYFTLAGQISPGTIVRNGVRGFKREVAWDKKKGKGTKGATITIDGLPPVEGSITLQLIAGFDSRGDVSTDFIDWDQFVKTALAFDPTKQAAQGLSIYYPGFSSIGLTQVVVGHWTPPEHQGRSLYHVTIQLLEWQPPPAKSAVKTVSGSRKDLDDLVFSPVENPEAVRLKNQLAMLQHGNRP